jgi:nitrite transporter NirC
MYLETVDKFAEVAKGKTAFFKSSLVKYFFASMLAGVYIGFGIMLIFSIGAPFAAAGSPALKILMGASFGIALTLVIFAGSELFTGNNMVMVIGNMRGSATFKDTLNIWAVSYLGNLAGSLALSFLIASSGLLNNAPMHDFLAKVVSMKMNAPMMELFIRGILCNMLVCLAIWMSMRAKDDMSKIFLIFWCLFAFIGSGFEHSVANMTLMSFPLFGEYNTDVISWSGFARNLLAVSLGNIVGGGLLIGATYAFISSKKEAKAEALVNADDAVPSAHNIAALSQ